MPFTDGTVVHSTNLNPLLNVRAVGAGYSASPPNPTATPFQVEPGSQVVTTGVGGGFTIGAPSSFPTGLLTVLCHSGDSGAGGSVLVVPTAGGGTNPTGFSCIIYTTSTGAAVAASGSYRINFAMIGW